MTRASDAEREAVVTRLRDAASEGRLTVEELAERIDAAYSARTQAELEPLTADLPAAPATAGGPVVTGPAGGGVASGGRSATILGILGGGDRKGRWRVPARTTVVNIMGGADLDLREAVLETAEVEITVWSLMGGSDITVPEGVHVELEGFALLGGNKLDLDPDQPAPGPGAPVVRVKAWSLMGGTDVKTRRSRSRRGLPDPPAPPPLP